MKLLTDSHEILSQSKQTLKMININQNRLIALYLAARISFGFSFLLPVFVLGGGGWFNEQVAGIRGPSVQHDIAGSNTGTDIRIHECVA